MTVIPVFSPTHCFCISDPRYEYTSGTSRRQSRPINNKHPPQQACFVSISNSEEDYPLLNKKTRLNQGSDIFSHAVVSTNSPEHSLLETGMNERGINFIYTASLTVFVEDGTRSCPVPLFPHRVTESRCPVPLER